MKTLTLKIHTTTQAVILACCLFNQELPFFSTEKIREASAQRSILQKGLCCRPTTLFRECRTSKTSCESHVIFTFLIWSPDTELNHQQQH